MKTTCPGSGHVSEVSRFSSAVGAADHPFLHRMPPLQSVMLSRPETVFGPTQHPDGSRLGGSPGVWGRSGPCYAAMGDFGVHRGHTPHAGEYPSCGRRGLTLLTHNEKARVVARAFSLGHAGTVRQTCRTASGWHRQSVATDMPEIASSKYRAWENISRQPKFHVLPR